MKTLASVIVLFLAATASHAAIIPFLDYSYSFSGQVVDTVDHRPPYTGLITFNEGATEGFVELVLPDITQSAVLAGFVFTSRFSFVGQPDDQYDYVWDNEPLNIPLCEVDEEGNVIPPPEDAPCLLEPDPFDGRMRLRMDDAIRPPLGTVDVPLFTGDNLEWNDAYAYQPHQVNGGTAQYFQNAGFDLIEFRVPYEDDPFYQPSLYSPGGRFLTVDRRSIQEFIPVPDNSGWLGLFLGGLFLLFLGRRTVK